MWIRFLCGIRCDILGAQDGRAAGVEAGRVGSQESLAAERIHQVALKVQHVVGVVCVVSIAKD